MAKSYTFIQSFPLLRTQCLSTASRCQIISTTSTPPYSEISSIACRLASLKAV